LTSELKERLRSGLLSAPARMLQAAAPFLLAASILTSVLICTS
jgi:hypothetical protein